MAALAREGAVGGSGGPRPLDHASAGMPADRLQLYSGHRTLFGIQHRSASIFRAGSELVPARWHAGADPRCILCDGHAAISRDYPEFRVWAGMMGGKEPNHAETQRASYS